MVEVECIYLRGQAIGLCIPLNTKVKHMCMSIYAYRCTFARVISIMKLFC